MKRFDSDPESTVEDINVATKSRGLSRRQVIASGGAVTLASLCGCTGILGGREKKEVSYRHRYKLEGLSPAANVAGVELGTWESEDLDVTFQESSGSQATVQAVSGGEDDFGNASTAAILQGIEEGASLTAFGHVLEPMSGVVSLEKTGITSWEDLEGKKVGNFPWSISSDLALEALERQGGNPEAVNLVKVQPGSHNTLLMEGEIDANISYWPQSKIRLENNGYEVNALRLDNVLNYLGVSLFTRNEIIENQPETVNKFVRGWLNAQRKFVTDLEAVVDAYSDEVTDLNMELERQTLGALYASRVPTREIGNEHGFGWIPSDKIRNSEDVLGSIGKINGDFKLKNVYTNQFMKNNEKLAKEVADVYYEELQSNWEFGPDL